MLESLALRCDGNHTYKSWKPSIKDGVIIYPTKEEAAHPVVLCERLASIFLHWATVRNLAGPRDMTQQLAADPEVGKRQLFTGQPRTKTLLQAVSEFGHYTTVVIPLNSDSLTSMLSSLPKGAKATSRIVVFPGMR